MNLADIFSILAWTLLVLLIFILIAAGFLQSYKTMEMQQVQEAPIVVRDDRQYPSPGGDGGGLNGYSATAEKAGIPPSGAAGGWSGEPTIIIEWSEGAGGVQQDSYPVSNSATNVQEVIVLTPEEESTLKEIADYVTAGGGSGYYWRVDPIKLSKYLAKH